MGEDTPIPGPLNNVIRIDDERIKGRPDRVVCTAASTPAAWRRSNRRPLAAAQAIKRSSDSAAK
jgi:hypothetical protein